MGRDLGQIVFACLENCMELERRKALQTVSTYLETGSPGERAGAQCHRNAALNRMNRFDRHIGLGDLRPYDAAAVITVLEWQGAARLQTDDG
ncbi:hypothetical protein [Streptomyces sp. NPDC003863]